MTNVSPTYPKNDSYIYESIYSDFQQIHFVKTLKQSFDLLLDLCKNSSSNLKKIVYLAEDIIEIAKSVPSVLNQTEVVDMTYLICNCVHEIARNAPRVEMNLDVNIDKQVFHLVRCKGYNI